MTNKVTELGAEGGVAQLESELERLISRQKAELKSLKAARKEEIGSRRAEKRRVAAEMYTSGRDIVDIMLELNISRPTVYDYLCRSGIRPDRAPGPRRNEDVDAAWRAYSAGLHSIQDIAVYYDRSIAWARSVLARHRAELENVVVVGRGCLGCKVYFYYLTKRKDLRKQLRSDEARCCGIECYRRWYRLKTLSRWPMGSQEYKRAEELITRKDNEIASRPKHCEVEGFDGGVIRMDQLTGDQIMALRNKWGLKEGEPMKGYVVVYD